MRIRAKQSSDEDDEDYEAPKWIGERPRTLVEQIRAGVDDTTDPVVLELLEEIAQRDKTAATIYSRLLRTEAEV